jgi:hypothetical protein
MYKLIFLGVSIDLVVVITWTFVSPLEYERIQQETEVDTKTGLIGINSVCQCISSNVNEWAFLGPLMVIHIIAIVIACWLVWTN